MNSKLPAKHILFVINNKSGIAISDWGKLLEQYLESKDNISYSICYPDWTDALTSIQSFLSEQLYDIVVAVGGDGTVQTVAKSIYGTSIQLGIIPAGSANGLARNLGIPNEYHAALDLIIEGNSKSISSLQINHHFCVHLSDLGFNAKVIKQFEHSGERGLVSYLKSGFRVLRNYEETQISIRANGKQYEMKAVMVVIANATMYGTGFVINPVGSLHDNLFELIIVRKYSWLELARMALNKWRPHQNKITILQCSQAEITSEQPIHFQVDGEYINKTKKVEAAINNRMIQVLVPET